jgi:NAD(P)-dependent dehydrogenase (short-subunit alcohol dehydrogenase family)
MGMAKSSTNDVHRPTERVALITGASRGLGNTVAEFLARQRWTLILTARHEGPLLEAVKRLQATGASITAVPGDVTQEPHRRDLVAAARPIGRLDLLINNASELGASPFPSLVEYPLEVLRHVHEVNVVAPLALIHECLPILKASRGLVVNITSDAARGGYPGWGGYGSSKAALELVSKTLANELRDAGVGVVSVDPGDLRTQMHQDAFPGQDISDRPLPEVTLPFWAWLEGQDPMRVTGQRFEAQGTVWEVPA